MLFSGHALFRAGLHPMTNNTRVERPRPMLLPGTTLKGHPSFRAFDGQGLPCACVTAQCLLPSPASSHPHVSIPRTSCLLISISETAFWEICNTEFPDLTVSSDSVTWNYPEEWLLFHDRHSVIWSIANR